MDDLKEYADRLKFEIVAADFLSTEDREMVFGPHRESAG